MAGPTRVLFLCTHNSARSQMAEALLRHLGGDRFEALSAGTERAFVRPFAVTVMKEMGISTAGQRSKTLDRYLDEDFDLVITLCDVLCALPRVDAGAEPHEEGEERLQVPPSKEMRHWSFPDPTKVKGTEEERLQAYRDVRDGLEKRIREELLDA